MAAKRKTAQSEVKAEASGLPAGVLAEDDLFTQLFLGVVRAEGYGAIGKRAMKDTTEQVAFACRAYYSALGLADRAAAACDRFRRAAAELEDAIQVAESKPDPRRGFEPHQSVNVPEPTKTPGPGEVPAHGSDYFAAEAAAAE